MVFVAQGPDGELRQQASVLRAATKPRANATATPSSIEEALAAGVLTSRFRSLNVLRYYFVAVIRQHAVRAVVF